MSAAAEPQPTPLEKLTLELLGSYEADPRALHVAKHYFRRASPSSRFSTWCST